MNRVNGIKHERCGNPMVRICYQADKTHYYPDNWQYCRKCDVMVRISQKDAE